MTVVKMMLNKMIVYKMTIVKMTVDKITKIMTMQNTSSQNGCG